jgi:hypothetical protein
MDERIAAGEYWCDVCGKRRPWRTAPSPNLPIRTGTPTGAGRPHFFMDERSPSPSAHLCAQVSPATYHGSLLSNFPIAYLLWPRVIHADRPRVCGFPAAPQPGPNFYDCSLTLRAGSM